MQLQEILTLLNSISLVILNVQIFYTLYILNTHQYRSDNKSEIVNTPKPKKIKLPSKLITPKTLADKLKEKKEEIENKMQEQKKKGAYIDDQI